jgi:hypothetical protein
MGLSSGTRLGPYEILGALGAGGMGEVYRARDTRLDRAVAVKVLPADRATDITARARFDREARAIAALNHPNICALHDVGHDAGHDFLVMELLEGETLQQRLTRGPLDAAQVVEVGIALADALDAAHGQGLLHRDLKPANIFLTSRGQPKILDFGLAKGQLDAADALTRAADGSVTRTGTSVGTVAYMSPEQLRAEPLDVRTDLFSLGLVLYEMATGQRTFDGPTLAVVSAAILTREPAPLRQFRADVPRRLEEVILKMLEKDRALRCQTAAELRADLMRVRRQDGSGPVAAAALPGPAASAAVEAASPPAPNGATTPGAAERRGGTLSWAVVGLVIIVGGVWLAWLGPAPPAPAAESGLLAPPDPPAQPPPPPDPGPLPSLPSFSGGNPPPGASRDAKPDGDGRATSPLPPVDQAPSDAEAGRPQAKPPTTTVAPDTADAGNANGGGRRGVRARSGRAAGVPAGALIAALKGAPPETYDLVFAARDPAARGLALQLRAALTNAGWTNVSTSEIPDPQARFGIFTPTKSEGLTRLANWARRSGFEPQIGLMPTLQRPRLVVGRQP